jgi:hypothetical protein
MRQGISPDQGNVTRRLTAAAINRVQPPTAAGKLTNRWSSRPRLRSQSDTDRLSPRALLRSWTLAPLLVLAALLLPAASALAAGDANTSSCPSSTESSAGWGASLPDCRAYELVSQADSGDLANINRGYGFSDHFLYGSTLPTLGEGTNAGLPEEFLATRTARGWQQTPLTVQQGETKGGATAVSNSQGVMFTGDFADALLMTPFQDALESPRLDETTGEMVYELSLSGGGVSTVSLPDSGKLTQSMIEFPTVYKEGNNGTGFGTWGSFLDGASQDGSRIFFSTSARLPTAPGTPADTHQASAEVYERTAGHTYLVGVLPDGEVPACGAEVGQSDRSAANGGGQESYSYGAVAPDGSNVVFRTPGQNALGAPCTERETGFFLRDVVTHATVKLPGGYAGRAGTQPGEEEKIFTGEGGKIFEYHVATGQTVEVAPEALGLLAYSASGARVYYLGPEGGIYLYEEGAPAPKLVPGTGQGGYGGSYITPGGSKNADAHENAPVATPDGSYLMFLQGGEANLYDAAADRVTCVSCGPENAAPQGNATFNPYGWNPGFSLVPAAMPLLDHRPAEPGREAVLRVVFQTSEALVPQDTNGTWDVYEWEQEETEGCSRAALKLASLTENEHYSTADHGCLYLLSSGMGREQREEGSGGLQGGSHLVGAGEGLTDIYIDTVQPMTGTQGVDNVAHVYDVRQGGGFPSPPAAGGGCEPGLCRPEGQGAPVFGSPASAGSIGAGNLKPAATTPTPKPKTAAQIKAEKLAKALKSCKGDKKKAKRTKCEKQARKQFGTAKQAKRASNDRRGN